MGMKNNKEVIDLLNKILKNELSAINQYFLHSRITENWGLIKLSKKIYDESIEEMQHADELIKRILFLEGLPNLQDLNKLLIGEDVKEIIECDLKIEYLAHNDLKKGIKLCEEHNDFVSRELLVKISQNEEEHIDWLETQLELIMRVGIENYQQSHM